MKILKGNFYVLRQDTQKLGELAIKSIETDKKFLKNMFAFFDERTKEILQHHNKDLRKFIPEMADFAALTVVIQQISDAIDDYLKDTCEKAGMDYSEFMSLVKPARPTLLMKYFEELKTVKEEDMDKFIREYKWVGTHGFEGPGLSKENLLQEKKKLVEKTEEISGFVPEELKDIQWAGSELLFYRSNIIETLDKICYSFKEKLIALGKEHCLSYDEMLSLSWIEMLELLDSGNPPPSIKTRKKNYGIIQIDGNYIMLFGDELEKELEMHQEKVDTTIVEFKGTTGYPGKVKGKVKIIRDTKEVNKVKKGEIMVVADTTPDFITAMEKAAAFVTDRGGITSHTTIVAREMRKPCIIGTKIATKVLKDGDLVEVDADKGVVRKL
ncbi:PEP-utilizing enzyme [Nanoarchaeota archaeon]